MDVGIMGLAASGKSTLFGLLTGQDPDAPAARHGSVQIGIARVPDPRLDALSAMYEPEKTTPATVRYVDVPGIPEEHRQEAAFNLPELRAVDALMVVVRAFKNDAVAHPKGSIDPQRDLLYIEEEFILQDQLVVEKRLERIRRDLRTRKVPELEREADMLRRCQAVLEDLHVRVVEPAVDQTEFLLRLGLAQSVRELEEGLALLRGAEDEGRGLEYGWFDGSLRPLRPVAVAHHQAFGVHSLVFWRHRITFLAHDGSLF